MTFEDINEKGEISKVVR